MSNRMNRRIFLTQGSQAAGLLTGLFTGLFSGRRLFNSLGATTLASSFFLDGCSTVDEYLLEEKFNLDDQVLIVGGGLAGLYLAYQLRLKHMDFRLFEGSNRFGGRIRSDQGLDFGAGSFAKNNNLMNKLVKDFNLSTLPLNSKYEYFPAGTETLIQSLVQRISGLMPYRHLRLQTQLIAIKKNNQKYECVFETPRGTRTYSAKKVVLAIPPNQWSKVSGLLELEEMQAAKSWLASIKTENIVKVSYMVSSSTSARSASHMLTSKEGFKTSTDEFNFRQLIKKNKSQTWVESEFKMKTVEALQDIDTLAEWLKYKTPHPPSSVKGLQSENFMDWSQVSLIQAGAFDNAVSWPVINQLSFSMQFHIVGDFATLKNMGTMEGCLNSVEPVLPQLI